MEKIVNIKTEDILQYFELSIINNIYLIIHLDHKDKGMYEHVYAHYGIKKLRKIPEGIDPDDRLGLTVFFSVEDDKVELLEFYIHSGLDIKHGLGNIIDDFAEQNYIQSDNKDS